MSKLTGALPSPFVRKVYAFCLEKGIQFESIPYMPRNNPPEYYEKSPLGKIPLWEDENGPLPDSSCICLYLEKVHPDPPLFPADPTAYGRALFFEEFSDSRLMEATSHLYFHYVIGPKIFGMPSNPERIEQIKTESQPKAFDWLERQIQGTGPLVGGVFSIADISVGAELSSLFLCGHQVDGSRWPKLRAYEEWVLQRPSLKKMIEDTQKATPA